MSSPARLRLISSSRAGDAGYLAAADVSSLAAELEVPYRLVGGNAVTMLVAAHGVGDLAPGRETADADFGADYQVVSDPRLPRALMLRGYTQVSGNRFTRRHTFDDTDTGPDVAVSKQGSWDLAVDVLAPSFTDQHAPNQAHGSLVVDEIPGLATALARPGTAVSVEVRLTTGHQLVTGVVLPDVVSAICLKAYAYVGRFSDRDALDLWRLLEAANSAGVTAESWPTGPTARVAADVLRRHFGRPGAEGALRASSRDRDCARIRALVLRVVGGQSL